MLTRSGPLRRTALRPRTARIHYRVKPSIPTEVRELLQARSGGWCEANLHGCTGEATDACHRIGRGVGGGSALSGIWHGCRSCHGWTHANPAQAYDLGLMLRSWQVPSLESMAYRDERWVLLGDDGTVWAVPE